MMNPRVHAAGTALLAAALFGITTPLARLLLGTLSPFVTAALFYLGSGIGLGALLAVRKWRRAKRDHSEHDTPFHFAPAEIPWFAGAIAAGGVAGPLLLMAGLARTPAATASLMLNLEGVLTAVIAWLVFRENTDHQIVAGMLAIIAGGVLLSSQPGASGTTGVPLGALLIAGACFCWAIDNNLTRKISDHDATAIACAKGLIAGMTNLAIALLAGERLPGPAIALAAMAVGFAGYGVSLVLFVVALRNLGTARTGAWFSIAPLFGVIVSLAIWPTVPSASFWLAAGLIGIGVWLHVRERHEHEHTHSPNQHTHRHRHDEHHQHTHDFPYDGREPHTHAHRHAAITHTHAHFPDIHHRHTH